MSETKKSVADYLAALTWDGTHRIDRWLVDYAGAPNTPYVRAVCRAVLVAAVRRARQPGCKIDEMLVIEGPQGSGKSAALRILAVHDDWYSDDLATSVGHPSKNKELVEATAGKWIVEISELQGMGVGDVAALKAFLSTRVDAAPRQPYQRSGDRVPRSFMVVGTTAETEYLRDPASNRRFWTVRVESFNLDRLRADRDQLWAEAAAAEAAGETIRVADEDGAQKTSREQISSSGQPDLRSRLLDFLMKEWARMENRQLVAVSLLYAPGEGYRDEEIRTWVRADEPEFFAESSNIEKLVGQIIEIAQEEADAKSVGRHRFMVRAQQYMGTRAVMSFTVSPAYFGASGEMTGGRDDRAAYVVLNDQFGVEFSSTNLDKACAYVSEKLRQQADNTALTNPSSYRIKRVPTA